jgi:hypothetical protein
MTRFFHAGREISCSQAVLIVYAHLRKAAGEEPWFGAVEELVAVAEQGHWDVQNFLADAGIYSTGMIGFGDEDDIPPLDSELWKASRTVLFWSSETEAARRLAEARRFAEIAWQRAQNSAQWP